MNYKNREKLIIAIACSFTIVLVIAFTLIGGKFKLKEEQYVSRIDNEKTEINISQNDYKIIKKEEKKGINTFVILEKKNFNKYEIGELTKKLIKDFDKDFNIYIFDKEEDAKDFNYENEKIYKVVNPVDQQEIQIQTYNKVKVEIENIPQNYEVKDIKIEKGITKVVLKIDDIKEPQKALGEIKFLGETIKDLNKDKRIEKMEIIAETKDNQDLIWKYSSENKSLITQNELLEILN